MANDPHREEINIEDEYSKWLKNNNYLKYWNLNPYIYITIRWNELI